MKLARSYSSLSLLASCAQKYQYVKGERLETPGIYLPTHAGSAFHAALRVLYKTLWDEASAIDAMREEWGDVTPPLGSKHAWLTFPWMVERLKAYMAEREASPTALELGEALTDVTEERIIHQWTNEAGDLVEIEGLVDLPLKDGRRYLVVDHKCTTMWVNDFWAKKFRVGMQLRVYAALPSSLTGNIFDGGYINGIYIGEKALDPPKAWEKRKSAPSKLIRIDFTPAQREEAHEWVRGLQAQQRFHMESGFWPRNENACDDYGGCEFLPLCTAPAPIDHPRS
jgi:hypothetical protein